MTKDSFEPEADVSEPDYKHHVIHGPDEAILHDIYVELVGIRCELARAREAREKSAAAKLQLFKEVAQQTRDQIEESTKLAAMNRTSSQRATGRS